MHVTAILSISHIRALCRNGITMVTTQLQEGNFMAFSDATTMVLGIFSRLHRHADLYTRTQAISI